MTAVEVEHRPHRSGDGAGETAEPDRIADDGDHHLAHPYGVRLRHQFQAAHRLPHLTGQCQSLHGHSWRVAVTVTAPRLLVRDRTVVEFGAFKAGLRRWIDTHLDHGAMLAAGDPLAAALATDGTKVFRFGAVPGAAPDAERLAAALAYPTVEEVAELLCRVAEQVLAGVAHAPLARVGLVEVEETDVNAAWYAPTHPAPQPGQPTPPASGAVAG